VWAAAGRVAHGGAAAAAARATRSIYTNLHGGA